MKMKKPASFTRKRSISAGGAHQLALHGRRAFARQGVDLKIVLGEITLLMQAIFGRGEDPHRAGRSARRAQHRGVVPA
jgi:hypothetical protein